MYVCVLLVCKELLTHLTCEFPVDYKSNTLALIKAYSLDYEGNPQHLKHSYGAFQCVQKTTFFLF